MKHRKHCETKKLIFVGKRNKRKKKKVFRKIIKIEIEIVFKDLYL